MRNQSMPNQTHGKKELEYGETQPKRNDMKEQRGGPQSDQAAGETDKGAHNQAAKGRKLRIVGARLSSGVACSKT
jgi:hypothetical protein